jgi:hypothetical protein
VLTDLEFYELRYSGKEASLVRGFRAVYLGLFFNCFIMGMVTLAACKIANILFGLAPWQTILLTGVLNVVFAAHSGLWGVLVIDMIQFFIKMTAVFAAAWFSWVIFRGTCMRYTEFLERLSSSRNAASPRATSRSRRTELNSSSLRRVSRRCSSNQQRRAKSSAYSPPTSVHRRRWRGLTMDDGWRTRPSTVAPRCLIFRLAAKSNALVPRSRRCPILQMCAFGKAWFGSSPRVMGSSWPSVSIIVPRLCLGLAHSLCSSKQQEVPSNASARRAPLKVRSP